MRQSRAKVEKNSKKILHHLNLTHVDRKIIMKTECTVQVSSSVFRCHLLADRYDVLFKGRTTDIELISQFLSDLQWQYTVSSLGIIDGITQKAIVDHSTPSKTEIKEIKSLKEFCHACWSRSGIKCCQELLQICEKNFLLLIFLFMPSKCLLQISKVSLSLLQPKTVGYMPVQSNFIHISV